MSADLSFGPGYGGLYQEDVYPDADFPPYGLTPAIPTPSSPFGQVVWKYDPVFRMIASGYYAIGPIVTVLPPLSSSWDISKRKLSNPVEPFPYDWSYDHHYYGSTIHNIRALLDLLTGQFFPQDLPLGNEKACRHSTFSGFGAYIPNYTDIDLHLSDEVVSVSDVNSPSITVLGTHLTDNRHFYAVNSVEAGISYPDTAFRLRFDVGLRKLSELSGGYSAGSGTQVHRVQSSVKILRADLTGFSISVSTECFLGGPYYGYSEVIYRWGYTMSHDLFRGLGTWLYSLESGVYRFRCTGFLVNFHAISCTEGYDITAPAEVLGRNPRIRGPFYTVPTQDDTVSLNISKCYSGARGFRYAVDTNWADIVPASLFSTVDAIESVEGGSHTDVLQTIAKLPEYKAMIPKLWDAIHILEAIKSRHFDASTVKAIVDLASTTELQGSFQWRPLMELLTVELPKIISVIQSFQSPGKDLVVGRGSWSTMLPAGSLGRSSVELVTRSKIVLDVSNRSLATTLLGVDALGILPKPSNLWDLVPYSFVLNWITGVGKNMERSEYAALLATLPSYYVHTYTLSSPLSSEELANRSLASSLGGSLSYRVFYRDVSRFSPLPHDSKFGFGLPSNLPPLGVVGALLWQVLT
uniref:Maturation n=2 Tax=Leviviricetes TaxID=2842243 RepID=A0A514DCC8_9VIRU|nr:MAG: hypothetical protein H2RhizoLitter7161_000003 [Leviviridae sp.]